MYFDRFDICEAWYLWLTYTYEGQASTKYHRLCKLLRSFKPRPSLKYGTLTENGREIFDALEKVSTDD